MDWILDHARLIGLLFFFAVFAVILFRTFLPGRKKELEDQANIPLKDDENR